VLSLVGLAQVAEAQGEQERAARLCGAAEAQVRAVGAKQVKALETMYPALYRTITQESMPAGRSQRDNPAYRAASAEGGTMTPEQAVAYAREEDRTAKPGWGGSEPALVGQLGASTGRD